MHRLFYYLLFLSFIFSDNSFASSNHAKVILLRGQVTFTTTNSIAKVRLKRGDIVPEGATVTTYQKSMAKLLFKDKTTSIIGPKSSLKLSQTPQKSKDKVGVISLLKGKIRTKFIPNLLDPETGKSKLYIKTKTAAMGIRGTDFSAIYNPSLDLTTTITFEGDVLLGKLSPGDLQTSLKTRRPRQVYLAQSTGELPEGSYQGEPPLKPEELQERLEKAVTDETAVSIKAGNFSSFNARSENQKPSSPTILSPRQFKKLKKNETFREAPPKEKRSLKKGKKFRPIVPPGMNPEVASAGEDAAKNFMLKNVGREALVEAFNKKEEKASKKRSKKELPKFLSGKKEQKPKTKKKKIDSSKSKKASPKNKSKAKNKAPTFKPGTIISPDGIPVEPPKGSQFDPSTGTFIMPSFLFKIDSSGNPVFATEGLKMNEKGRIVEDNREDKKENPKKKKNEKKKTNQKNQKKEDDKKPKGVDLKDVLKKVERGIASGNSNFEKDIRQVKNPQGSKKGNSQGKPGRKKRAGKGMDSEKPPPAPKPPKPSKSKKKSSKVRPPNIRFIIK